MMKKIRIKDRIISGLASLALFSSSLLPSMQVFSEEIPPVQESAPTNAPLKLTDLSLKLASGINEETNGVSGWKADQPAKGHEFTYNLTIAFSSSQSNFSEKGKLEAEPGDIQIHIPLHILKNQSGSWADELTIWYPEEHDPDIADNVKYAYRIDEEHNEIVLYNRIHFDEAQSIAIPFSYMTTENTWNYQDMEQFTCQVKIETAVTLDDGTLKPVFIPNAGTQDDNYVYTDLIPAYLNTEAEISSIRKTAEPDSQGSLLRTWNASWGTAPESDEQYLYTVWKIESKFKDVTQKYTFCLNDLYSGITEHDGTAYQGMQGNPEVIGYRLSGQSVFSDICEAGNQTASSRKDYVLVRYDKSVIDALDAGTYQFENSVTGTVTPQDGADPETNAEHTGYFLYTVEDTDTVFIAPNEKYELSKYGIYSNEKHVENHRYHVSSYQLKDLIDGDSVSGLTYELQANLNGYIRTLADGSVSFASGQELVIGDSVILPDGNARIIQNGTRFELNHEFFTFLNSKAFKAEQLGTNTKIKKQDDTVYWIVDKSTAIPVQERDTVIIGGISYEAADTAEITIGSPFAVKDGEETKQIFLKNYSVVTVNGEPLQLISGSAKLYLEIGDIIYPSEEISVENAGLADDGCRIQNSTAVTLTNEDLLTQQKEIVRFMDSYLFSQDSTANFITGTQQDAQEGWFGRRNVTYEFTDQDLKLENSVLNNTDSTDYIFTELSWKLSSMDAEYSSDQNAFVFQTVTDYSRHIFDQDANFIEILITKDGQTYEILQTIDLKSDSARNIDFVEFPPDVTGWKFEFHSPYASHKISLFPELTLKGSSETIQNALEKSKLTLEEENYADVVLNNKGSLQITGGNAVSSSFNDAYQIQKNDNDFIASVVRSSQILKSVSSDSDAVRVNKGQQYVAVKWTTKISETINKNTESEPKIQSGGIFYDYLPLGSTLLTTGSPQADVAVYAGEINRNYQLQYGTDYTYRTEWDTAENRQKLLIKITAPSPTGMYSLSYATRHNFWDINDYGRTVRNSVAYQTGNEDIANGRPSDGGGSTMQDAALLSGWIPSDHNKKYLYEQAYYTINSLIPSSAGISKKTATPSTNGYAEHGVLNMSKDKDSEAYSYQVRWANSTLERAKNIIILDALENYQHQRNGSSEEDLSEWHGTLAGFDFSALENKGVAVRVYLTSADKETLDFETLYSRDHSVLETDLNNGQDGIDWVLWDGSNFDLDKATAFAVDLRQKKDGTEYMLGYNQSFYFIIHMKAPALKIFNDDTEQQGYIDTDGIIRYNQDHDPETNNSIFRSYDSVFDNMYTFGEHSEIKIDQTKTKAEEIIVKQKHPDEEGIIKNIETFRIAYRDIKNICIQTIVLNQETHQYETEYTPVWTPEYPETFAVRTGDIIVYTDSTGAEQTLQIQATDEIDWISSSSEYGFYAHTIVTYHAVGNMKIAKASSEDTSQLIPGIPFHLYGTSWYDSQNMIEETLYTNEDGFLVIENLPRGEYTLQEQAGNPDWVLDPTVHTIVIDAYGNTFLDNELLVNDLGTFQASNPDCRESDGKFRITIDNRDYIVSDQAVFLNRPRRHGTLILRKVDSFDASRQLYGAEFVLKSDPLTFYHNEITESAVSSADGSVIFADVEQGRYTLTETVFPDGYVPVRKTYQVICDENGSVSVTNQQYDDSGAYLIENIPYAELKLRKLDDVNQSEMLGGTEFTLTLDQPDVSGTVDESRLTDWSDRKQIKITSSNSGIAVFSQLLDGQYTLTETKASPDGKHVIDETNPPAYQIIVKDGKIASFQPVSGTNAAAAVLDRSKATGEEWLIYNTRTYENQVTVNKKWIGQPMQEGFPVLHLAYDESQHKIKTATISKQEFQEKFDLSICNFIRHGEGYDAMTLEEASAYANHIDSDDSGENELYADETGSVYMWQSGTDLHFWTDAEMIYLPADCENLISGKTNLISLDFSGFFCDKVTTMKAMFSGCTALESIEFGDYFTEGQNVRSTEDMFRNCTNLKLIDLDHFSTSGRLTSTAGMFRNCQKIHTIKIGSMDTSNVTDMSYMFGMDDESDTDTVTQNNYQTDPSLNTALTSLVLTNLSTENCTAFRGMFQGMSALKTIALDYTKFTAGTALTSTARMFNTCQALTSIDLRGFGDCSNLASINRWFRRCNNLKYIDLANFSTGTSTGTHLADISLSFYLTGKYDNNDSQWNLSAQDGCAVYTKGKWNCTPDVVTYADKTFDCFRILLYGTVYKNTNTNKGSAEHLDIQKQGHIVLDSGNNAGRPRYGYFNDSNSDYYKTVFCPGTYASSSVPEESPDEPIPEQTSHETALTGYKTEKINPVKIIPVVFDADQLYEESNTYQIEYITGGSILSENQNVYTVPETIRITVLHTWYDNPEMPSQKYEQETVYTKEITAVWKAAERTENSEWVCEIQVYDDTALYTIYEEVPKDPNGKEYHSSARQADKLKMTEQPFTITNSQSPIGSLSVSKVLTDSRNNEVHTAGQENFIFEIALQDQEQNPVEGEIAGYIFHNGKITISLRADETILLSGIPAGYTYTVTELTADSEKYTRGTVRSLPEDSPASGTILSNRIQAVTWQNLINTSGFALHKTVTDNDGLPVDDDSIFTFHVSFSGLLQNYPYSMPQSDEPVLSGNAGTLELTLAVRNGQTVHFTDLPIGTDYQISEISDDRYLASYQTENQELRTEHITDLLEVTASPETVTFTNQKLLENEPVNIRVTKKWQGEENDLRERPESITILLHTYKANVEKNPETNKISSKQKDESFITEIPVQKAVLDASGSWTYTFENLDRYCIRNNQIQYEYYYEIEETEVPGYTSSLVRTEILNADDFITSDQIGDVAVEITNTKYPGHFLQIQKEVTGNLGNKAKAFTFELTAYQIQTVGLTQEEQKLPLTKLLETEGTLTQLSLSAQPDGTAKGIFSLADGDFLKIKNIPDGTYLSVREIGHEAEGYTVSAVYQFDGAEESAYHYGDFLQLNQNLNLYCRNERSGVLPTGRNMHNPVFLLASTSLLCSIAVFCKKRKKQA